MIQTLVAATAAGDEGARLQATYLIDDFRSNAKARGSQDRTSRIKKAEKYRVEKALVIGAMSRMIEVGGYVANKIANGQGLESFFDKNRGLREVVVDFRDAVLSVNVADAALLVEQSLWSALDFEKMDHFELIRVIKKKREERRAYGDGTFAEITWTNIWEAFFKTRGVFELFKAVATGRRGMDGDAQLAQRPGCNFNFQRVGREDDEPPRRLRQRDVRQAVRVFPGARLCAPRRRGAARAAHGAGGAHAARRGARAPRGPPAPARGQRRQQRRWRRRVLLLLVLLVLVLVLVGRPRGAVPA
jgi:hypothetical protein